jgi:hypothetical protein
VWASSVGVWLSLIPTSKKYLFMRPSTPVKAVFVCVLLSNVRDQTKIMVLTTAYIYVESGQRGRSCPTELESEVAFAEIVSKGQGVMLEVHFLTDTCYKTPYVPCVFSNTEVRMDQKAGRKEQGKLVGF